MKIWRLPQIGSNVFKDPNDLKQVSLEYGAFCSLSGYFSEPHVIDAMGYEDPLSWWC